MSTEPELRTAALRAVDRFCARMGFPTPELAESKAGYEVCFVGKDPNGWEFGIGYTLPPENTPLGLWPRDVAVPLRAIPERGFL